MISRAIFFIGGLHVFCWIITPLALRNFPFSQSTCGLNSLRNGYPKSARSCPRSDIKNYCFSFLPLYISSSWHERVICPALLFDPSTLYTYRGSLRAWVASLSLWTVLVSKKFSVVPLSSSAFSTVRVPLNSNGTCIAEILCIYMELICKAFTQVIRCWPSKNPTKWILVLLCLVLPVPQSYFPTICRTHRQIDF